MMTVPAAVADALREDQLRFAWLLDIGDTYYFTNHAHDITHGGETYISQGHVLQFAPIVRERAIKLQSYSVTFSNVDGLLSNVLQSQDLTGAPCEVFLVLLSGTGAIIGDAISLYKGAFDSWTERDTATTATITVKITSPWDKPNLTAGRYTSDHNQQDNYAGDKFFEFAHEEKNTIGWGAEVDGSA